MTKRRKKTVLSAAPGAFEARLAALLELPAPAPKNGTYAELRAELAREERESLERAAELRQLLTAITGDARAHEAAGGIAALSQLAGHARGHRAGLRAARRLAEEARVQAGRAVEGLQDEVLRLNDEVTRLKAELDQLKAAREKKVRSVRKDGVHVPENADEAQRVARNIEEFLKVAQGGVMDLEEIRARLPEEANVRDAMHHLLLSRRATLQGTQLRLAQAN